MLPGGWDTVVTVGALELVDVPQAPSKSTSAITDSNRRTMQALPALGHRLFTMLLHLPSGGVWSANLMDPKRKRVNEAENA